jgi:trk system potassium uptake protein TrkA
MPARRRHFAVSHAICPEQEITDYIARLIEFPEALQVLEFADGRVTLVCVRAYEGGLLVGKPIKAMREHLPPGSTPASPRSSASTSRSIPRATPSSRPATKSSCWPRPSTSAGDARAAPHADKPVRRIMIAGGGNIGARVARRSRPTTRSR